MCRPRKPCCLSKTGTNPQATPSICVLIAGGNRRFVTLAYTTIASFPTLFLLCAKTLHLCHSGAMLRYEGGVASIHRAAEKRNSRKLGFRFWGFSETKGKEGIKRGALRLVSSLLLL